MYPGHILSFRRGGPKAGRHALLVQLFPKGSKVAYWKYAHRNDVPSTTGDRLLWEMKEKDLVAAGCERVVEEFPDGGM